MSRFLGYKKYALVSKSHQKSNQLLNCRKSPFHFPEGQKLSKLLHFRVKCVESEVFFDKDVIEMLRSWVVNDKKSLHCIGSQALEYKSVQMYPNISKMVEKHPRKIFLLS